MTSELQPNTIALSVGGMTCATCQARVQAALSQVPSVTKVEVDLLRHEARVEGDASFDTLREAGRKAGYLITRPTHEAHAQRAAATQAKRDRAALAGAMICLAPLLILGMRHRNEWPAVQALLAFIIVGLVGLPHLRAAAHQWRPPYNMSTLVALSTLAALTASLVGWVRHSHLYFEAAGSILVFVAIGKALERSAKARLVTSVQALLAMRPLKARKLETDGSTRLVHSETLLIGDLVQISPNERIAVDGQVTTGSSAVNEAMLTGEALPRAKQVNDLVYAGTDNLHGALTVRVAKLAPDSELAALAEAVKRAEASRGHTQDLADRISAIFVPSVLLLALLTAAYWGWLGKPDEALSAALSVLVVACPCALGLATPAAIAAGTGSAARKGWLFKGGEALERASKITTVVLDKTGTLTSGHRIISAPELSTTERLAVASLAAQSNHPLSQAIAAELSPAANRLPVVQLTEQTGEGLDGLVDVSGRSDHATAPTLRIRLGKASFCRAQDQAAQPGQNHVFLNINEQPRGVFVFEELLMEPAQAAVAEFQASSLLVVLASGDQEPNVAALAARLNIQRHLSTCTPADKAALIQRLLSEGQRVAMVGDGVNDAPALALATLGVSVPAPLIPGKEAAMMSRISSDLALPNVSELPKALAFARRTTRIMQQNLFLAFAYNSLAIPTAMSGHLSPMWASLLMSLSSVSVLLNAMRLLR